jgi:uncharacterized membrane protein
METLLLLGLIVVLVIAWIYLRDRLSEMDRRINALASAVYAPPKVVRETASRQAAAEPPAAPVEEAAAAAPPVAAPSVVEIPVAAPGVVTPPVAEAPLRVPAFAAAAVEEKRSSEEWEALLGGNWLNKLGMFVLVIGIALLLGYSFKHLGPGGIDAICVAISVGMLGTGVALEGRERYRTFARGLLGGGWAALYFTVYAMQAVAAARILYNPWVGAILLLGVAGGMIAHSLRYRSQAVTGMAYFIAFVTLAITEVTVLSIVALVPLAASLLYIARRASWGKMALFGLIATYATCATRPDLGAPLWQVQAIFVVYWLLFEGFDLLSGDAWLLPLNALGFLSLSLVKWQAAAPHQIWQLLAATAAAYLASGILRARSGRWHAAITLAAALAAAAIFLKLDHQWVAFGLLVEAELLYLAGVRLRQSYLRMLAAGLFSIQAMHLLIIELADLPARGWTPLAALEAVVFYANRALRTGDLLYGYAGAGMLALVAGYEAPEGYRAVAWMLLALGAFAWGWRYRLPDFRMQGYLLAGLGLCGAAWEPSRLAFAAAAAMGYGLTLCALKGGEDRLDDQERAGIRFGAPLATVVAIGALLWKVLPDQYLGLGWMAMSLALLEVGLRGWPGQFRRLSYAAAAVGALRVLFLNVLPAVPQSPLEARLIPAGAALLCYAMAWRAQKEEGGMVGAFASAVGTVLACDAVWLLTPAFATAPVLALFAVALLVAKLRPHAYAVAAVAFAGCWWSNLAGGLDPVLGGGTVVVCLYATQFMSARGSRARWYLSLLGTALWTLLLYYQVAGNVRTVAWGIEGVALLGSGFPLRDRVLRLSGLALLLGCILKLFLWDLRHLETLARIFSFLALGLFLVGVSWIYTRFRGRVDRYL